MRLRQILSLRSSGQEDHGQGEAPEASGPEAGGQEQQDEQAPPIENPLADGGEKEIAAEAPEKQKRIRRKLWRAGKPMPLSRQSRKRRRRRTK